MPRSEAGNMFMRLLFSIWHHLIVTDINIRNPNLIKASSLLQK